jgi:hypothetical protein
MVRISVEERGALRWCAERKRASLSKKPLELNIQPVLPNIKIEPVRDMKSQVDDVAFSVAVNQYEEYLKEKGKKSLPDPNIIGCSASEIVEALRAVLSAKVSPEVCVKLCKITLDRWTEGN